MKPQAAAGVFKKELKDDKESRFINVHIGGAHFLQWLYEPQDRG